MTTKHHTRNWILLYVHSNLLVVLFDAIPSILTNVAVMQTYMLEMSASLASETGADMGYCADHNTDPQHARPLFVMIHSKIR